MLEEPLKWPCFTAVSLSPVPHAKGPRGNNLLSPRSKSCINDWELPLIPSAQATRGTCCSPQLKTWFVYSSSINLEDGFSVQAGFIIYLVPNIYYLFSVQNATGLSDNTTEAESIPWKAFRLIKRKTLKQDEWGWMDKDGLEEIKYWIAPHYSQSYFIQLSVCMGHMQWDGSFIWMQNGRLKGKKVKVAVWTPKRTNRWRDGKDKEPESSPWGTWPY